MNETKEFLTSKEACSLLGCSRKTLWGLVKKGDVKAFRLGPSNRCGVRYHAFSIRKMTEKYAV